MQVPVSPIALIICVLSVAGILLSIVFAVGKEAREYGMTPAQRLQKAEAALRGMAQRMIGFQQHARTAERFDTRCATLEKDTAKVEKLSIDMATMQEQLNRPPDMERKPDHLTTLLTGFLAKKGNA